MNPEDQSAELREVELAGKKPGTVSEVAENPDLKNAVHKMSEGKPQILQEIMAMGFSSGGNPLHQKMNEGHVTQVLDLVTRHDERQFELTKNGAIADSKHRTLTTWFAFIGGLVFIGLLVFVILIFKGQPEVLTPILTGMGGLVGGGLAGFGIGKSKRED